MDFIDQISSLASRAHKQLAHIKTEEATKNALVLPFINALGYNVFDPLEVVPEFTADVGIKKGEKIDYAIMLDGQAIMLIECKHAGANLNNVHASQLFRYFHVTEARVGVLTNGIQYRFYSDLEQPNKMDERPFLEFSILDIEEGVVQELKKLSRSAFDIDELLSTASELKYTKAIRQYLTDQWASPSDELVRFLTKQVYDGSFTQAVREQFTPIVKRGLNQFVSERISDRLKSALRDEEGTLAPEADPVPTEAQETTAASDGVETTEDEMEAFRIVRAILREVVDVERVAPRDVKTYFGVLLDDNNRKPLVRLHFNTAQKYVGLFNADKSEERVPITTLSDIYKHADRIKAAAGFYTES